MIKIIKSKIRSQRTVVFFGSVLGAQRFFVHIYIHQHTYNHQRGLKEGRLRISDQNKVYVQQ